MLKKLKHKLTGTEEKKRLAGNIFSLGVLQGANYILPLLTLPYLVRVLGPEYFGLLAFATATILYFMLITDYGFNLSATRQISIHRDDKDKVNEIFSSVMMIKTTLMVVSFGLMSVLVFSIEKFSQHWEVYFITFGMVIGQVLFPVWLFQGMERMKYITYLNIGAKAFFTVCIFIFVQEQADYLFVPLLNAMGFIVAGIWSLYLVKKEFNVRFAWQTAATLKFQLAEGWHVFFSSMAISLYTISTTFILGLFTDNTVVGYFAAADKIVQAVKGINAPISQAIYPLISKKIHEDKQAGLEFIRKTTWVVGAGMFIISVVLLLLADPIVNLLLGDQFQQSVLLLQIMSFLPLIVLLSGVTCILILFNLGFKKIYTGIYLSAALIGMLVLVVASYFFEAIGITFAMVALEFYVLAISIFFINKKGVFR
jgi:PST family polysaccharide transporter